MNMKAFVFGSLVLSFVGCGPEKMTVKSFDHQTNTILWENVPAEFHPEVSQNDVNIVDIQRIHLNIPGAMDKVEVIYSSTLPADTGVIKIYSINGDAKTTPSVRRGRVGNIIQMSDATNTCELKAENGQITDLKGYCYARIEIILRENTPVEVYSGLRILTAHYFAKPLSELLNRLAAVHTDSERVEQVADFAASYQETGTRAQLRTSDLTTILRKFESVPPKMQTLRLLHIYISDRKQLESMIENEFEYFDRAEARKIVGLPL